MSPKMTWLIVVGSTLLAPATTQAGGAPVRVTESEIPPVLFTTIEKFDPNYPTFVAGGAAFDADGEINRTLFHPHVVENLLTLLREEPVADGCHVLGEVHYDEIDLPARFTLEKTIERSPLILIGQVTDQEYGFRGIQAGQLLAVTVEEAIKGAAPLDTYYIFVPVGEFVAGPHRICKHDPNYASPPAVGTRVMVMVPRLIRDASEPYLDIANAEGLIVFEEEGAVRLPSRLQREAASAGRRVTAESVVSLARQLTIRSGGS